MTTLAKQRIARYAIATAISNRIMLHILSSCVFFPGSSSKGRRRRVLLCLLGGRSTAKAANRYLQWLAVLYFSFHFFQSQRPSSWVWVSRIISLPFSNPLGGSVSTIIGPKNVSQTLVKRHPERDTHAHTVCLCVPSYPAWRLRLVVKPGTFSGSIS